ncbi:hypothetical protein FRC12_023627 [Ceratobasidium sp. 428]|nr:hypothetical protein FRC12_023627 [Ceratobasidium sp. 428]
MLPLAIRPTPTHGQSSGSVLPPTGLAPVNRNTLPGRILDVAIGSLGGPLRDNAINPMLNGLTPPSGQGARSIGDDNSRQGHIRNAQSEDISSSFRVPELVYTAPDGSRAPPPTSFPLNAPSDVEEGGVGFRRRGYGRSSNSVHRASPYHSPNASPRLLPGDDNPSSGGFGLVKPVEQVHVTTPTTREASSSGRTAQANFKCPIPGCGSTFTRHLYLRSHIRSHNEERPFKCSWTGCDKTFARQDDCQQHEILHLNIGPYM